jgi:hypothetical protein
MSGQPVSRLRLNHRHYVSTCRGYGSTIAATAQLSPLRLDLSPLRLNHRRYVSTCRRYVSTHRRYGSTCRRYVSTCRRYGSTIAATCQPSPLRVNHRRYESTWRGYGSTCRGPIATGRFCIVVVSSQRGIDSIYTLLYLLFKHHIKPDLSSFGHPSVVKDCFWQAQRTLNCQDTIPVRKASLLHS